MKSRHSHFICNVQVKYTLKFILIFTAELAILIDRWLLYAIAYKLVTGFGYQFKSSQMPVFSGYHF